MGGRRKALIALGGGWELANQAEVGISQFHLFDFLPLFYMFYLHYLVARHFVACRRTPPGHSLPTAAFRALHAGGKNALKGALLKSPEGQDHSKLIDRYLRNL